MPDEITLQGNAAVERRLRVLANQLRSANEVGRLTFAAGEAVRSYMVRNMLSGQRLRRVTGKLAGDWRTRLLAGGASLLATNTIYAPAHEFGVHKTASVTNRKGTTYKRRMNLRERKYFRDSIRLSKQEQLRAIEIMFDRMVK